MSSVNDASSSLSNSPLPGAETRQISLAEMAQKNTSELTEASEEADADMALRWRRVVLSLSDNFSQAAATHPHLAPFLMEAMGKAIEQLLLFGREGDLVALDEWLAHENNVPSA